MDPLDYAVPPPAPPPVIDWMILTRHLMGWAAGLLMLWWMSVYVIPNFERTAADFKLNLPYATKVVFSIAGRARDGGLFVLLVPLAIGHSVFAALWHRRAGRGPRLVYRLLLFLAVASVTLFVILALFLPMVGLIDGLAGGASPKK